MKTKMKSEVIVETIELGTVGVDSGTMMLCDPCYVMGRDTETKEWGEVIDEMYSKDRTRNHKFGQELNLNNNDFANGVVFDTGFGDGTYDVTIDVVDLGKWGGKKVKSATITFFTEEEVEDLLSTPFPDSTIDDLENKGEKKTVEDNVVPFPKKGN